MSSFASKVINEIPDIQHKSYLELGVAWGENYSKVNAGKKTGVELLPYLQLAPEFVRARPYFDMASVIIQSETCWCVPPPATHIGITTDEFFSSLRDEKFDVIFVDADHTYTGVVKDFTNAIKHLNPGGIILVHDLVPKSKEHSTDEGGSWNGSGFKMLAYFLEIGYPCAVLDCDFGLTAFRSPQPIEFPESVQDITYEEFCQRLIRAPRYSLQQLLEYVKS